MKLYNKVIVIIVIVLVTFRICIEFKLYISNHGEDTYQIEKSTRDNDVQRVFTYTQLDFKKNIQWQQYLIETIPKLKELYKQITENYSFEYINEKTSLSLEPSKKTIHTIVNMRSKTISTGFDHSYCSGHFFLEYGTVITNGKCPNLPLFPRYFGIAEYYLIKFAVERPDIPTNPVFSIVKSKKDMKRLFFTLNTNNVPEKCHTRTWILFTILKGVLESIEPKKTLNVMIPVPFKKENKISNNIGVIFVKFNEKTNIIKLQNQIDLAKTQAIASNYYLKLNINKKIGKEVRNNVDIIFSSGYIKNSKTTNIKSITTYNGIPDYGLYCLTAAIGNVVNITLTISTLDINKEKLQNQFSNSEFLDFNY